MFMSRWKLTGLAVCSLLPVLLMTGCSSAGYRDGSYRAEAADFDQSGWKDYVQLTVSDGKVTEIEYDAISKEDGRKRPKTSNTSNSTVTQGWEPTLLIIQPSWRTLTLSARRAAALIQSPARPCRLVDSKIWSVRWKNEWSRGRPARLQ